MTLPAKLLLCVALLVAGFVGGTRYQSGVYAKKQLADVQESRKLEQRRTAIQIEITKAKDDQIRTINNRLADALGRLRKRPERLPVDPSACAGGTGAQLSAGDGEFLARLASDAASQQADLRQCIDSYNALTSK